MPKNKGTTLQYKQVEWKQSGAVPEETLATYSAVACQSIISVPIAKH